jgi:hypothetical protein
MDASKIGNFTLQSRDELAFTALVGSKNWWILIFQNILIGLTGEFGLG